MPLYISNLRARFDAALAKKAHKEKTSLREAAIASGHLTGEQFNQWVDPEAMTRP